MGLQQESIVEIEQFAAIMNLMRIKALIPAFVLIFWIIAPSLADPTIAYYDAFWNKCSKKRAKYKRETEVIENRWVIRDYALPENQILSIRSFGDASFVQKHGTWEIYFKNGNMAYKGDYRFDQKQGPWKYFWENGNLSSEGNYLNDKPIGVWKDFYQTGELKSEYEEKEEQKFFFQCFNTSGEAMLVKGTGVVEYSESDRDITLDIRDSILYANLFIRKAKKDTVFLYTHKSAEYIGGLEKFYEMVRKKIKYPQSARRMGIQGRVFVEFLILTDGELEYTRVVKGIQTECDNEAKNVVALSSGNWIPARFEGKKVKSILTVPVHFNLR